MKKIAAVLLLLSLLTAFSGCGGEVEGTTVPETTQVTETAAPTTAPPVTETVPPTTETVPPTTVVTEPPTEPAPVVVDESWFDDALFIGESRTAGLQGHGRLGDADYFCGVSVSVYGILNIRATDQDFGDKTLSEVLSRKTYGKIYIHLGINEVGGDLDRYITQYQKILEVIREKQPDARIIIQSVLSLSDGYSENRNYSRENIQAMNDRLAGFAAEEGLHFSDENAIFTDEEGYLKWEYTFDGCHMYPSAYEKWAQWLLEEATIIHNAKGE